MNPHRSGDPLDLRDQKRIQLQKAAIAHRVGGHAGRKQRRTAGGSSRAVRPGLDGGSYRPLSDRDKPCALATVAGSCAEAKRIARGDHPSGRRCPPEQTRSG